MYKAFDEDFKCRGFQFEVGKTYEIEGELIICKNGFHACKKAADVFNYYPNNKKTRFAKVEFLGSIVCDGDKSATDKIKVIKEIYYNDFIDLTNSGHSNSGYSNSGNSNSGHSNSGHSNSGDWNSGHSNSGDWNSGNWNSGDSNSGHSNSGNRNSGYSNSGDWNSGDWNSGFFNSKTPEKVLVFNKECSKFEWDQAKKPSFIYDLVITEWVYFENMTEEEQKNDPDSWFRGGYLKKYDYKEAWSNAYKKASSEDMELLKKLPNFDSLVFKEITGIKI